MKPSEINVLIACEESQTVCKAFRERGLNAFSCDLIEPSGGEPQWHLQMDVFEAIALRKWDLMIAHPPCTHLSVSGQHWFSRGLKDVQLREDALEFVRKILGADVEFIALENPVSIISSRIRKPDQIIQPYMFGDDASKKTCLWLKNLPALTPTKYVEPRTVEGKKRWSNQEDDGRDSPRALSGKYLKWSDPETAKIRSKTFPGIAQALASQWGDYILNLKNNQSC